MARKERRLEGEKRRRSKDEHHGSGNREEEGEREVAASTLEMESMRRGSVL